MTGDPINVNGGTITALDPTSEPKHGCESHRLLFANHCPRVGDYLFTRRNGTQGYLCSYHTRPLLEAAGARTSHFPSPQFTDRPAPSPTDTDDTFAAPVAIPEPQPSQQADGFREEAFAGGESGGGGGGSSFDSPDTPAESGSGFSDFGDSCTADTPSGSE